MVVRWWPVSYADCKTSACISQLYLWLDVRRAGLDAQEMKSISLLENVATLMHFLFAQTKQPCIVRSAFISGWFHVLWNAYQPVQWQGGYWGAVIRPTMCKTAHKRLLHRLVDFWCGLEPMGLLFQFIARPACSTGSLCPPPTPSIPPHLPPTCPLICATRDLSKVWKKPAQNPPNPTGHPLRHLYTEGYWIRSCISSATLERLPSIMGKVWWIE